MGSGLQRIIIVKQSRNYTSAFWHRAITDSISKSSECPSLNHSLIFQAPFKLSLLFQNMKKYLSKYSLIFSFPEKSKRISTALNYKTYRLNHIPHSSASLQKKSSSLILGCLFSLGSASKSTCLPNTCSANCAPSLLIPS